MPRYFALPVLGTVLALVGIRMIGAPSPKADEPLAIVVSLPQEEPPARPEPAAPPVEGPKAAPAAPAPTVIVLEPLPAPAAVVRTEVVERTVYVPQQPAVIYAPTTIYGPVIEQAPPPPQEVVETPVIIVVSPAHGRPTPPARRPRVQQDSFFKDIPFLPPTPKGPRWSP